MQLQVPTRSRVLVPATHLRSVDKADADDTFTISGHAAVFDSLSDDLGGFYERIQRGAFKRALDGSPDVRFLVDHRDLPLARTTSNTLRLWEDPRGLAFEADVVKTPRSLELRAAMHRGDVTDCSFQFTLPADESGERWARTAEGKVIRTILRVESLLDVAVVTFPAYRQAGATARSIELPHEGAGESELDGDVPADADPSPTNDERAEADRAGRARRSRQLALARLHDAL